MATFKLAKKDALSYTRTNIYDLYEKKIEYFDSEKEKLPEYILSLENDKHWQTNNDKHFGKIGHKQFFEYLYQYIEPKLI